MAFFEDVLPDQQGWVPILSRDPFGKLTRFKWFCWPSEKEAMVDYITEIGDEDVYFSPMLYTEPPTTESSRWATKANVLRCVVVYADGDDMDPDLLKVKPTTFVRSSRDHWQAYWRFTDADSLSNFDIEDLSHGLYDAHASDAMDRGWPLAKKLRVPYTMNTKPQYGLPYEVNYETDMGNAVTAAEFAAEYPPSDAINIEIDGDAPLYTPDQAITILSSCGSTAINDLFIDVPAPGEDWSSRMYRLECLLFEEGKSIDEVYVVMAEAACNKYARDDRPDSDLWMQVQRDHARWAANTELDGDYSEISDIDIPSFADANTQGLYWSKVSFLHDDEVAPDNTVIDMFVSWAQSRSAQSPWEFNVAGILMLLSATLSRYAKLPLTFGDMPLNLYFMVLGRTTQSRKSTSMRLARSLVRDITDGEDDMYWVPDDTTPEALNEWLAGRPRQSTVYVVDEFQDTLNAVARKGGYLSGLIAFLTKAYDGDIPGVLRKTGNTKYTKGVPHYLSFYGTGILNQSAAALTVERIESGFVPRCIIVTDKREGFTPGANDVAFLDEDRTQSIDTMRSILASLLKDAIRYWSSEYDKQAQFRTASEDSRIPLGCEPEAFKRWQEFSYDLTLLAANHPVNPKAMFPICERLSYSVLKVAALVAMYERSDMIRMRHMLKAISLADTWAQCSEILVTDVLNNGFAKDIAEIEQYVASQENRSVKYKQLLTKFQGKFDNPKRLTEVLQYCISKGTLKDVLVNKASKERVVMYVQH